MLALLIDEYLVPHFPLGYGLEFDLLYLQAREHPYRHVKLKFYIKDIFKSSFEILFVAAK